VDVIALDHLEQLMVIPVVHMHPDDDGVDPHFDDFECRDLLHAGRSESRLGGTALNLGLQAAAKMPSQPGTHSLSVEPEETVERGALV
jgi:hypothetical protein